ncbi:MAG: hypothetical protein H0T51_06660 [Pirellulales bacterium]|nr:hypothetical protein [Pirellulales bacterium]
MIADTLPAETDSERQLVAALLVDPSQIAKVRHMLPASAMVHPLHRTAFDVLATMDRRGEAIDVSTLKSRLEGRPEFAGDSPMA